MAKLSNAASPSPQRSQSAAKACGERPRCAAAAAWTASVALGAGAYSGRPIPAHHKHVDRMGPEHFTRWLSLFERTLEDIGENDGARSFFMERAQRIGARFQDILFSDPQR